jgi:hypothetical protein
MPTIAPPYNPTFGTGAPGAGVNTLQPYYDTSTTPYTEYVFNSAAWHIVAAAGAGTNATSLQGTPVSAAAPANLNVLQLIGGVWTPAAGGGGASVPVIVQSGAAAGTIQSIVLGAAPTKGNKLVALFSHFGNNVTPNNPAAGLGWQNFNQVNGVTTDGFAVFIKTVGAGESTTQTPLSASNTGGLVIYEISGEHGIDIVAGTHDSTATPTFTQNITTTINKDLILFMCVNVSNATNATSVGGGLTQDQAVTGGSRALISGHMSATTAGAFAPSATYAANQNIAALAVAISP